MDQFLFIHKTFEKVLFDDQRVSNREYDGCIFRTCDFSGSSFTSNVFIDCEFIDCNMSNMDLQYSSLKTVSFKTCKLMGVAFDKCEDFLFRVSFEDCILDYTSFTNKKLQKTKFINCSVRDAGFSGANLAGAVFANCNLEGSVFDNTELRQADLSSAYNYSIDPENNSLKQAKFSMRGIEGLLGKYDIKIV